MIVVTPEQMREMDRRTIADVGIPGLVLMERAALGAVDALLHHFELSPPGRIGVLCGRGNNGGDGFAMARMLSEVGFDVVIGLMAARDAHTGDAETNLAVCTRLQIPIAELADFEDEALADRLATIGPCDVWCDALFGTGLDRDVEGRYAIAIEFLLQQRNVFAVDVPSGINAENGHIMGVCTRADATATFGSIKVGQLISPGRQRCGTLYPIDIGIPASIVSDVGHLATLLTDENVGVPRRPDSMHKGNAGRVLLVGGSLGKTGAILMAARGALLSGAGLLTVGTDEESLPHIAPSVAEVMAAEVLAHTMEQSHLDQLEELVEAADVVAIGPGMGMYEGAREALEFVLAADTQVVLDADGLNLLSRYTHTPPVIVTSTLVLTPHPGEAARLRRCEVSEILADPIAHACELADEYDAIVVLKGATTVIADADGNIAFSLAGNAGMATGGMGDALTGIIAAQLCEPRPRFESVAAAVYAHGCAGDHAALVTGTRALTVSALLDALPSIWSTFEQR